MRLLRVALVAALAASAVGCGGSSSGPKEEKPLPANRIPKTIPPAPKK